MWHLPRRKNGWLAPSFAILSRSRRASDSEANRHGNQERKGPYARLSESDRGSNICPRGLLDGWREQGANKFGTTASGHEISLHWLPQILGPRRLSCRRSTLGHSQCHQPEYRRICLEDSLRRISRTRREGHEEHRHGKLRRPHRYGRWSPVYRRNQFRQKVPRLRQIYG